MVHPSSCTLAPQRWSPPPSLMAQTTFFLLWDPGGSRLPSSSPRPSIPPGGSSVWPHSYLLSCGLHTCSVFPSPKHTLLRLSLTSRPGRPSSLPSSPFTVCSKPSRLHTSLHPRAPGSRATLLFPWPCYPGFLRLSPRQSSLSLVASPPIQPPRTKPPQFLHHRTWPAGRRPPHAGLRPEQEEGGGETERDRGEPSWALPQRQPRLRVRPQTRPRPQTHPSTPSKDGVGAAVPRRAARLG